MYEDSSLESKNKYKYSNDDNNNKTSSNIKGLCGYLKGKERVQMLLNQN